MADRYRIPRLENFLKVDTAALREELDEDCWLLERYGFESMPAGFSRRGFGSESSRLICELIAKAWDRQEEDETEREQSQLTHRRIAIIRSLDEWADANGIVESRWVAHLPEIYEAVGLLASEGLSQMDDVHHRWRSHRSFSVDNARRLVARALAETGVLAELDEIDPYRPFADRYRQKNH